MNGKQAFPEQKSATAVLMAEVKDRLRDCTLGTHQYPAEGWRPGFATAYVAPGLYKSPPIR